MTDYVEIIKGKNSIQVCFDITDSNIMAIGEKMNEIQQEAYMNGYNWDAFFHYYLKQNAPEILEEMNSDPEADMYVAFYPNTSANEARAEKFMEIIQSLMENEEKLYQIVKENGDDIAWD